MKVLCQDLKIPTTSILSYKPDWGFDGADKVNKQNWLIKGRGAAMLKEKLNIANARITYILVDNRILFALKKFFSILVYRNFECIGISCRYQCTICC